LSLETGTLQDWVGRPNQAGHRPAEDRTALHTAYAETGDPRLRHELFCAYQNLAFSLARRFPSRRESPEDLCQVACIGLLHAIDRFDPGRERPFLAFAHSTITGELKRHIRDHTWTRRVARSLQEHYLVTIRTVDDLTAELGRSPRLSEVTARSGLSADQVLEAMELGIHQYPVSLDVPTGDGHRGRHDPPTDDRGVDWMESRALAGALLERLPEREQEILRLRFAEQLSQAEIAARVGVSQMHVSRLLARTLARLRRMAGAA